MNSLNSSLLFALNLIS